MLSKPAGLRSRLHRDEIVTEAPLTRDDPAPPRSGENQHLALDASIPVRGTERSEPGVWSGQAALHAYTQGHHVNAVE